MLKSYKLTLSLGTSTCTAAVYIPVTLGIPQVQVLQLHQRATSNLPFAQRMVAVLPRLLDTSTWAVVQAIAWQVPTQSVRTILQTAASSSCLRLPPVHRPTHQASGSGATADRRSAGFIDLVGVTEAYSGALTAARHRVDDASSDSALARALAEKADLERQLKVQFSAIQPCAKRTKRCCKNLLWT